MGDHSKIEWTDASWNPIRARDLISNKVGWHCEHATTGCEHCYSEGFNKRLGTGLPFKPGLRAQIQLFLDEQMLIQPLCWKKPRMIFVCSMTDLFADFVPDEWIDRMLLVMALCPQHTFQLLTKRAARMRDYITTLQQRWDSPTPTNAMPDRGAHAIANAINEWPLPNVWLGVSTERQREADERVPHLLNSPAAIRFVSAEPLLGPIDFRRICLLPQKPGSVRAGIHIDALAGRYCESGMPYTGAWDITKPAPNIPAIRIHQAIVGGESGPKARPMHPDWARSLRDQCSAAGTAFFFKQWGNWKPLDQFAEKIIKSAGTHAVVHEDGHFVVDTDIADPPRAVFTFKMGKHPAGRLLDGVEHNGFPKHEESLDALR